MSKKVVPIIEPLDPRRANLYEHTPLDYYGRGEYPRFIRPIGAHQPRVKVVYIDPTPVDTGSNDNE